MTAETMHNIYVPLYRSLLVLRPVVVVIMSSNCVSMYERLAYSISDQLSHRFCTMQPRPESQGERLENPVVAPIERANKAR